MKKTTKSLIIAIASVVVLVGAFLAVYFLLPSQDDSDTASDSSHSAANEYLLINHVPADLKRIDVENETGKYTVIAETPTVESTAEDGTVSNITKETIYTLVGYEDMELLEGSPDTLADDASSVSATKIVNDGSRKSDFGFDSPRAVVNVTFTSGEKKTIRVGDDAPDSKGAYLMVDGDEKIYLVESDSVDGFLVSAMGMLSTEIGTAAQDDDKNVFTKMVFGGTLFEGKEISFEYNNSNNYTETYMITSPDNIIANEETVTYMLGSVRNLTAEEVAAVNVDENKIKEYGLDEPYVTVEAEYPDLKVNYKATKADEEGKLYLLSDGIIYKMDSDAVPWASYTYDKLIPSDVLSPKYDSVDKITVEDNKGGKKYEFDITRTTETVHDEENDTDSENVTAEIKCNGKNISEGCFSAFYQNLTSAQRTGLNSIPSDQKSLLKVTYEFSDGQTATAEYFSGENRKCFVLINGTVGSTAYESYVTKIIEDAAKTADGETVSSIY